ncbi:Peptidase family M23 [Ruegeria intermedia]|uniref:Peptidase family M23 n=1 Tax=Ruegeria intermedia TaxID=996115 RepID=A0A1M4YXV6_9RHOB|nr:Peptidase family M23 [Ruegeria intermedia]
MAIVHEGGWETQYCHLRQGSVEVAPGDRVSAGTVLGQIGLSGKTQFPHLHLSVRRNGQEVDPFDPDAPSASCGAPKDDLWDVAPRYQPGGLLTAGFSDAIPKYETVLEGTAAKETLEPASPAMVLFGHAFGGRKGDIIRLRISGPDGTILSHESVLEKAQAQLFRAAGRPLTAPRWPAGAYTGTVEMVRDGRPLSSKNVSIFIP